MPILLLLALLGNAAGFLPRHRLSLLKSSSSSLDVLTDREADFVEMTLGGQRYEMVPLPDRMMETTVFVGNICEFVHDEDLSNLFQSVSKLQSLPAVVVRRANMASLQYGFVTFPNAEEKEVRTDLSRKFQRSSLSTVS